MQCCVSDDSKTVAEEFRSTPGTVIIFSVWHHEAVLANTFLGEVVLPLCDLRELTAVQTVHDLPAVMVKLRRPKEPRYGPFKVCKSFTTVNKKLNYRRVTARCVLSVVILPITTQQCRNYLYDKS